jgi:hypothetical protein
MKSCGIWQILSVLILAIALIGGIDQVTKNALKVQQILNNFETQRPTSKNRKLTAEVTQTELNAYIKHRLTQDKDPCIKGLQVVLLEDNHVRGKLRSNSRPFNLSFLFGDILDFDFKGILYTRKGKARLALNALELNGQPIKPEMLDLILSAAAQFNGTPPARIGDWYELPKGIHRITVNNGKAVLYDH